jgi:cell division protein FtsB
MRAELRTLPRRLLAIGTALFAFYLVLATGQRALDAYRVQQQVEGVRREVASLQARNLELQAELSSGKLDEDVERIAREELGLVRPGDKPLILIWPEGDVRSAASPAPVAAEHEASWLNWVRLFVDINNETS